MQEKVLRVIEYGEFERLGGSETITVSVRVVAATNLDLPSAAREGRFREDLLDRLAFDVLTLPPLRARVGDVALLAEHFGRAMAADMGWELFPGFSPASVGQLEGYAWPGNVRELKNVVERAVAGWPERDKPIDRIVFDPFASPFRPQAARSQMSPSAQPSAAAPRDSLTALPDDFRSAVANYESGLLARALAEARHNQRAAAKRLGLGYHQLRNLLRKHGLMPARGKQES